MATLPAERMLCTVEAVVAELKLTDKAPDTTRIEETIAAASQAIRLETKRNFVLAGTEATERRIWSRTSQYPDGTAYVAIPDAAEIVGLTSEMNGGHADFIPVGRDEALEPVTAIAFASCPGDFITVEARWGWPQIPEDVREACVKQAAAWYGLDSSRLSDSWGDELSQAGATLQQSGGGRSLLKVVRDLKPRYRFVKFA